MKVRLSSDARPQAMTLLVAAALSIILWFIPFAEILTYPFRLFVTFIHEGGHAIAALLTGNSVGSLSVALNASGETYTTKGGLISQTLVASSGYLGSMAFGALLLVLIRKAIAARAVLIGSAVIVFALTISYGLFAPDLYWGSPLRYSFHTSRGNIVVDRIDCGRQVCKTARGNFLCKLSGGAVRAECPA